MEIVIPYNNSSGNNKINNLIKKFVNKIGKTTQTKCHLPIHLMKASMLKVERSILFRQRKNNNKKNKNQKNVSITQIGLGQLPSFWSFLFTAW